MSSKKQKQSGHLIPDPITGYDLECISFNFPANSLYKAALLGQITELCKWWNWDKTYQPGDTRATEAAQYMRDVLLTQELFATCEGASLFNVRQNPENGCELQKTEDGELWVTFANLRLCRPRLRIGAGGIIQWFDPIGETWQNLEDPPLDPTSVPPENNPVYPGGGDNQCMSAVAAEAGIKAILAQLYQAALIGGAVTSVIAALGAGLSAIFTGGLLAPIADAIASAAAGIVSNWGLDFGNQLLAYDWQAFRCLVFENMPTDGVITEQAYADIAAALDDEVTTVGKVINIVWDLVGFTGAANMIQQEAPNIDPAEECCQGTLYFGEPYRRTIIANTAQTFGTLEEFFFDNVPAPVIGFRVKTYGGAQYNGNTIFLGHENNTPPSGYQTTIPGGAYSMAAAPGSFYVAVCSQVLDNTPPTSPNTAAELRKLIGDFVDNPQRAQLAYVNPQADGLIAAGENWYFSLRWASQVTGWADVEITPIHYSA